jgi:RNA-directed DNA polymerase
MVGICRQTHDELEDSEIVTVNKSKTQENLTVEWNHINWRKLEKRAFKLQKRIYRASSRGDVKAVRRLQKTLMKSWSAKCLAVRRVTQDNRGKKTAGVDGAKSLTPKQRLTLVKNLKLGSKTRPTRRVWIDKPGRTEKRPLGIPTMYDRAAQALVKLALEPEWEAKFEPNSYGFRPGRSCQDAIGAIFNAIRYKAKYVLDADIAKCFDCIDHNALLNKLNTFPTIRRQIRAWLKAGVIDWSAYAERKGYSATSKGTPQGGVISPLLANIALHGMENGIGQAFSKRNAPILIRYADDFVILHENITVAQRCQTIISEWLKGIGLELKPSKTRLTHTLNSHEGQEAGFNFLGFNIRQYPAGKYTSGRNPKGNLLGFKSIIKPCQENQKTHYEELASLIEAHKTAAQLALIGKLNPKIRGWANYYSSVVSKEVYKNLDDLVYRKLMAWAKRRQTGKPKKRHKGKKPAWTKYWTNKDGVEWVFANRKGGEVTAWLDKHSATEIKRHEKVKGEASPYDGNLIYWSKRVNRYIDAPRRVLNLIKEQYGKCTYCGLFFRDGDVLEVDHKKPFIEGGQDYYKNLQLLHGHCHDRKTADDIKRQQYEQLARTLDENPW